MKTYVVWCECASIDVYGHPTQWILGVFETKRDAVVALEDMSDECRIIGWHGGGGPRWKLYKRLDDGTETPVTANDMAEWGVIPTDEIDWNHEDPEFFIEERDLGVMRSTRLGT